MAESRVHPTHCSGSWLRTAMLMLPTFELLRSYSCCAAGMRSSSRTRPSSSKLRLVLKIVVASCAQTWMYLLSTSLICRNTRRSRSSFSSCVARHWYMPVPQKNAKLAANLKEATSRLYLVSTLLRFQDSDEPELHKSDQLRTGLAFEPLELQLSRLGSLGTLNRTSKLTRPHAVGLQTFNIYIQ